MFQKHFTVQRILGILIPFFIAVVTQMAFAQESKEIIKKESSRTETHIQKHKEEANKPRIAVTDLSYEEKVRNYFLKYDLHESSSNGHSAGGGNGGFHENGHNQSEVKEHVETGIETTIDRGELRKFTADIKGELIKSGLYRVVQGKPWVKKDTETMYDIINRIKEGYYPDADYVLFGSINSVDFRNETNPIQGSNAVNYSLSLEMVGEFSLINTKTYEVVASFSATGEGQDARLVNSAGTIVNLNRSKVVREVSQSLGIEVAKQTEEQFSPHNGSSVSSESESQSESTIHYENSKKE